MQGLKNKVVVVAGSATGIGLASARRLAAEGAKVALGDIAIQQAQDAARQICQAGGDAIAIEYDQSDEASTENLIRQAVSHFGRLDGLHANAADLRPAIFGRDVDVLNMDVSIWERTLRVNLIGYADLIRRALPHLLERGGGSIINMSSVVSSVKGAPNRFIYGTTKAAVIGLTRSVAADFVGQGIRCNAICPGTVETPSLQGRINAFEDPVEARKMFIARQPIGRLGTAEEIANLALYLASDESSYTTGAVHVIDGAWSN